MPFSLDLSQIAELPTQIATSGALRAAEIASDDIFEYVIAVATLIYELSPDNFL